MTLNAAGQCEPLTNANDLLYKNTSDRLKALKFLHTLVPLTSSFKDEKGRQIQLFKLVNYGMVGVVWSSKDHFSIIPKNKIRSAFNSTLQGVALMERMEKISQRRWDFVFDALSGELLVLPYLEAAARFDKALKARHIKTGRASPISHLTREELINRFEALVKAGKFERKGDPASGKGAYYNKTKGIFYHIDHRNRYGEPSHLDVYRDNKDPKYKKPEVYVDKWRFAYKDKEDPSPGKTQFHETLQKTGLTKSFNSCHKDHPAPAKGGASGEIGGVGCTVDFIEGLFDSPESLFVTEHTFFIPAFEGDDVPFDSQELNQILQELAYGIFVHHTVPFFSLHFNEAANLYPVIHPAYEHTLVGKIFSMLDYFMKGYLNGGVFKEDFVQEWQKNPSPIPVNASTLQQLISFKSYAETHLEGDDQSYKSARLLLKELEVAKTLLEKYAQQLEEGLKEMLDGRYQRENPIFGDYTKFTNSFRIIAKQKGIYQSEGLFVISPDFDVHYTVEPHPDYQQALEEYYKVNGCYPAAYEDLIQVYEEMKRKIHDHMVKMPFCRKYFALLGVINFFTYYFMTLKKHRKFPLLPKKEIKPTECPALFPPLPLSTLREFELKLNLFQVLNTFIQQISQNKDLFIRFLSASSSSDEDKQIKEALKRIIKSEIFKNALSPLQQDMQANPSNYEKLVEQFIEQQEILEILRARFTQFKQLFYGQLGFSVNQLDELIRSQPDTIIQSFIKILIAALQEADKLEPITKRILEDFVPPTAQSEEELEKGKRIVGGCGMDTSPLRVKPSLLSDQILEQNWETIQNLELGECVMIKSHQIAGTTGMILKLGFDNFSPSIVKYEKEFGLLEPASTSDFATRHSMRKILKAMAQNEEKKFDELIQNFTLHNIKDSNYSSLLHHSVRLANLHFTSALMQKGLSPLIGDNKNYLPIHYAAMYGHVGQLKILVQDYPQTIDAPNNQGATPLIVAIQHGQIEAINWLISQRAKGDRKLNDGYTVLHCAVHRGDLPSVKLLLEQSKRALRTINAETNEGITPLMIACAGGSSALVSYLLEKGADPKKKAKNGKTALDHALKHDDLQLCQLLAYDSNLTSSTIETAIKKNSLEINRLLSQLPGYLSYRNSLQDTPLLMALRYAHLPLAEHILSLITNVQDLHVKNRLKETPIELAIRGKFYSFLEKLLKRGMEIAPFFELLLETGYKGESPLINAALEKVNFNHTQLQELLLTAAKAGNHVAISKLLIPKGIDLGLLVGPKGWRIEHYLARSDGIYLFRRRYQQMQDVLQPLMEEGGKTLPYLAGECSSQRVFSFLINQIKKLNLPLTNHYLGRHLFYSLLERANLNLIRLFVEKFGASSIVNHSLINDRDFFPIHLAAQRCSAEILDYLYRCGMQCNLKDHDGRYPLFYAVQSQRRENIAFLLNENHRSSITADAIFCAASFAGEEILDTIIKAGANLDDEWGLENDTPLLLAIKAKNTEAFLKLIQRGASVDYQNQKGWTPLLLAAKEGQIEILKVILAKNPNAKREKKEGSNALHIACQANQEHCAKLLINHGFSIDEKNESRLAPIDFTSNSYALKATLGKQPEQKTYLEMTAELCEAITKKDLSAIMGRLSEWPINDYFTVNLKRESMRGTLLHLALREFGKQQKQLIDLVTAITGVESIHPPLKDKFLNRHLRDSEGNLYAHLMIKYTDLDPTQFQGFPLEAANHLGQTPLHFAAIGDNLECLKNLIRKLGPSQIDPKDHQGFTPLLYGIRENKRKQVKELLKGGANVNLQTSLGITPLIFACSRGNYPMVRLLVKFGADVNLGVNVSVNKNETIFLTPLSTALLSKREEIPLFLLFHGAQCHHMNNEGQSIAHTAAMSNKTYILRLLAEQGLSISTHDNQGWQPIHHAAAASKINAMKFLFSQGISLETRVLDMEKSQQNIKGATPLLIAVKNGRKEGVKWLLDHGADPDVKASNGLNILQGLMLNSAGNAQDLLQLFQGYLLANEVSQVLPAVSSAIAKDYVEAVKLLYAMGIPISSKLELGYTGLHFACQFGALHVTEFLLTQGAEWNLCNDMGQTPLELAAANSSPSQFQLMLNFINPPLELQNNKGETLMHLATQAGNLAHVMLLIDEGADFDIQDSQGFTPLHIAVKKGFKQIVEILMLCGANLNLKTLINAHSPKELATFEIEKSINYLFSLIELAPQKSTPLHLAVRANHPLAVQLMLRHFSANQKNALGQTALHDAVYTENLEIIRLLLDQGASPHEEDLNKMTPLMIACKEIHNPKVRQFLEKASSISGQGQKTQAFPKNSLEQFD